MRHIVHRINQNGAKSNETKDSGVGSRHRSDRLGRSSYCVRLRDPAGSAKVTGTRGATTTMIGSGTTHDYCINGGPGTAAAGPAGSSVTFAYAPATCGTTSYQLSAGTYDVRLRNVDVNSTAWTGNDTDGWTQVAGSGCFAAANVGGANNYHLADMTVDSTGTGSKIVTLPSTGLVTNGLSDASIFCVGKYGAGTPPAAPTGTSPGFLAPFRVTTV